MGAVAVWYVTHLTWRTAIAEQTAVANERLLLYESTLRAELAKYRYLPYLLSKNGVVRALVSYNGDPRAANLYLEEANRKANSAALYIMGSDGTTLAASNWRTAETFVGHNYSFRPYFQAAKSGQEGNFFAIGVTTGQPGFFMSHPIYIGSSVRGVAVVKVDLNPMQANWRDGGETVFVTDVNGVIFLSSRKAWKYHSLSPLNPESLERIRAGRQYRGADLSPLAITREKLTGTDKLTISGKQYLLASKALAGMGWTMHYLVPFHPIEESTRNVAISTGASAILIILMLLFFRERRLRKQLDREAREAARVLAINQQLESEVKERRRTESELRKAQQELIQAGKLAALGQMSTAIAHELNQPIAAIRTSAASCRLMLKRGQTGELAQTLGSITGLTERMAKVTGQLKSFARKTPGVNEDFDLRQAIGNAIKLLEYQIESEDCKLREELPESPVVLKGDSVRLEQVFVNLIRNALDAMRDSPNKSLRVELKKDSAAARVCIADNGTGIAKANLRKLFDPFFTTKEAGEGVGLGLSISYGIVKELGGEILAENRKEGGALFTVRLPLRNHD